MTQKSSYLIFEKNASFLHPHLMKHCSLSWHVCREGDLQDCTRVFSTAGCLSCLLLMLLSVTEIWKLLLFGTLVSAKLGGEVFSKKAVKYLTPLICTLSSLPCKCPFPW